MSKGSSRRPGSQALYDRNYDSIYTKDSGFHLSTRSMNNLWGVDERLVNIIKRAIKITPIDFAVIEGLRTEERQKALVERGASMTMNSLHRTGHAVDLMGYVAGRGCWEMSIYDDIAAAVREAAMELDIGIRWGGCWTLTDIRDWDGTMEQATEMYITQKHLAGKKPFLDGPHFELSTK